MDLIRLKEEFAQNFETRGELGASVAVYQRGEPIIQLAAGFQDRARQVPWTSQTRVLIWSATKGVASACLLHACSRHGIDLDSPITRIWPEYGQAGKERTTFRHALSHQAGQPALRGEPVSILDHEAVVRALAGQAPFWEPGSRHGYHARTYGFLVDELVRRIAGGINVGRYFRQVFGDPLGLDIWIGMPETLTETVAPIQAPRKAREKASSEDPFYAALNDPGSLSRLAFSTPSGLATPSSMNAPSVRAHVLASFGGIATADGLARFYQLLCAPNEFFNAETLLAVSSPVASGIDEILKVPTAFSTGFMMDAVDDRPDDRVDDAMAVTAPDPGGKRHKLRTLFGPSVRAFGQPGAGGSHAFADPEHEISFAYVMNQMEPGLFPNEKSLRLVDAIYVHRT